MLKSRSFLTVLALSLISVSQAEAKCSTHSADSLIKARYSACKSKDLVSYLHNNIITPYSFTCAKQIVATCKKENCSNPKTAEETARCEGLYVDVLNACPDQLDGPAKMARCQDSREWPVAAASTRTKTVVAAVKAPEAKPEFDETEGPAEAAPTEDFHVTTTNAKPADPDMVTPQTTAELKKQKQAEDEKAEKIENVIVQMEAPDAPKMIQYVSPSAKTKRTAAAAPTTPAQPALATKLPTTTVAEKAAAEKNATVAKIDPIPASQLKEVTAPMINVTQIKPATAAAAPAADSVPSEVVPAVVPKTAKAVAPAPILTAPITDVASTGEPAITAPANSTQNTPVLKAFPSVAPAATAPVVKNPATIMPAPQSRARIVTKPTIKTLNETNASMVASGQSMTSPAPITDPELENVISPADSVQMVQTYHKVNRIRIRRTNQ